MSLIEVVGIPETFEKCTDIARPGSTVANVGVQGKPAELWLQDLWIKRIR
jgi:alcohol dehydrogenase